MAITRAFEQFAAQSIKPVRCQVIPETLSTSPDLKVVPRSSSKSLSLGVVLQGCALTHDPSIRSIDPFSIDRLAERAALLEEIGYDEILLGSPQDISDAASRGATYGLEVFTAASYLAVVTKRLRINVAVNTNYLEPFGLARLLASLDHISDGRAGWIATIDETDASAFNYQSRPASEEARRARRAEAVSVIEQLIASWEADAFLRDKQTGDFVDPGRIHRIDHAGRFFCVRGPLNVARPPQGSLPRLLYVDATQAFDTNEATGVSRVIVSGVSDGDALALKTRLASGSATPPKLLKRVTPAVAGLSHAHDVGPGDSDAVWRGTIDEWRLQWQAWEASDSAWDGILLELTPADYLNTALIRAIARRPE